MKKNVLIVTDYAAVYEGNFIRSIKFLTSAIENDGHKVFFLFIKKARELDWISSLDNVSFLDDSLLKNIKIINDTIKKNDIGILYTHFCLPKTQLAVKFSKLLNKKVKMFSHFHNHYKVQHNKIKELINKFAFEGDINIGCSESVADSLPYKNKKKCFVNNGIDFFRFKNINYSSVFEQGKFNILMFGYTPKRKGVDLAIEAIKLLNNNAINLYICISKNKEGLEVFIKERFGTIPDFVKIIEPTENVEKYYKSADLFISPSREEGYCYSVVESIYCGNYVICSDIPGNPNDIPGVLRFKSEDVKGLSNVIKQVYDGEYRFDSSKAIEYVKMHNDVKYWCFDIKNILFM